jgi:hypothetical protein
MAYGPSLAEAAFSAAAVLEAAGNTMQSLRPHVTGKKSH